MSVLFPDSIDLYYIFYLFEYSRTSESEDELDDTITRMEKLLAMADEQEALENALKDENTKALSEQSPVELVPATPESAKKPTSKILSVTKSEARKPAEKVLSATKQMPPGVPMMSKRIMELKGKRNIMFSPSPPRPRPNAALPRGIFGKPGTIIKRPDFSKPEPVSTFNRFSRPNSPAVTAPKFSVPKSPVLSAPKSHCCTPRASPKEIKPMSRGGFRGNVLESPVANYIHSRASPSPFQRTMAKENANSCASSEPRPSLMTNSTRIPRPSFNPPTPSSKTVKGNDLPIPANTLRESRMNTPAGGKLVAPAGVTLITPVKMGTTKPDQNSASKFKNLHYSGPNKAVAAPCENAIAGAFRHTGTVDLYGLHCS